MDDGLALDVDDVAVLEGPVGLHVLAHLPLHAELDPGLVARHPVPARLDPGDAALVDLHEAEVVVLRRDGELRLAAHGVELEPERVRHHVDAVGEDGRALLGHRVEARVVDRMAEADALLRLGGGVARGVDGLGDRDAVDAVADPGRDEAEQVREARIHPAAEDRGAALLAGGLDPLAGARRRGRGR